MRTYRYFEWTTAPGTHPSGDQLLEALADSLTEDGDITRAIQTLMQRGMSAADNKMQGLREMLEQLRKRKQQQLDTYDLNSLLNDMREQLDRILQQNRQAVEERRQQAPSQAAEQPSHSSPPPMDAVAGQRQQLEQRQEFLDNLPKNLPQRLQSLRHYGFLDRQAAQAFQQLLEELQRRARSSQLNGQRAANESSTTAASDSWEEMYEDLNRQLREKLQGRTPDFQRLKSQHPQFPSAQDSTVDELIQRLQKQLQQWRSLLESLADPMRRELEQLMDSALEVELRTSQADLQELLERLAQQKLTP